MSEFPRNVAMCLPSNSTSASDENPAHLRTPRVVGFEGRLQNLVGLRRGTAWQIGVVPCESYDAIKRSSYSPIPQRKFDNSLIMSCVFPTTVVDTNSNNFDFLITKRNRNAALRLPARLTVFYCAAPGTSGNAGLLVVDREQHLAA
ncbi:TPA: hypothetical protein QDB15_006485 [Burkholderia vietnamiensis]|uniref:hypothetical protein n=1 Tax=Burkholderia TaxID=32008 RepID=UPI0011B253B7|nr:MULTISPECIES: hypothetical protein [Burkholderia]MCA8012648.1 hypothetical protein [Burkholderia vietnamiensis]MCA8212025.1 hypothetical protein [Burkholderia vietnamiensis]MCB4342407.1 hypothetical protein [Burkholderia vietnamiensis]HDR8941849.1 hypothetical protein [Burkholderia vietnamiensis]HDR9102778.1 hypothetical protein [Burkholderia vietnamiensis]